MDSTPGNTQTWGKDDWKALAAVSTLLMLYPLMNGYPFVYYDSWSYASGLCRSDVRSPVLGCFMRPVVLMWGTWGIVVIQSLATGYAFIFLAKHTFGKVNLTILSMTVLFAGLGLYSGWLMADIWMGIGLLLLFCVLTGHRNHKILLVLGFTLATHYGNFPIFAGIAILFTLIVRNKIASLVPIAATILFGVVLVSTTNLMTGWVGFSSKSTYTWIASRIIYDIPEVLTQKCQEDPGFKLCDYEEGIMASNQHQHSSVMFYLRSLDDINAKEIEYLSKQLVLYSIPRFPIKHTIAFTKNTFSQIYGSPIAKGFLPLRENSWIVSTMRQNAPLEFENYNRSWQAQGRISTILKKLEIPSIVAYWAAMVLCLVAVLIRIKHIKKEPHTQLALFALISIIVNGFFMSNLSGVLWRFHTRIVFIPILAALYVAWVWAGKFQHRFIDP
jgi:hypothetical protein